jgi:hypothetical protein
MSATEPLAIIGAITGPIGAVLGWIAFWRDAPRVFVEFQWDMTGFGSAASIAAGKPVAVARIANIGRRPIYVNLVHIEPQYVGDSHILFGGGISGQQLAEGTAPWTVWIEQAGLEGLGATWWRVRVSVVDTGGRIYRSRWPTKRPSFASEEAPPLALVLNTFLNWLANILPR